MEFLLIFYCFVFVQTEVIDAMSCAMFRSRGFLINNKLLLVASLVYI